jgi:cyclic beta-1,2-glucan synthetase
MIQTAFTENHGNVYTIGEPISDARRLAAARTIGHGRSLPLVARVNEAAQKLADATHSGALAPEVMRWLTDNSRLVNSHIMMFRKTIREHKWNLPVATNGPFFGYPRILEIAIESSKKRHHGDLVEAVGAYVREYQTAVTLLLDELWALHTFLTLAQIEGLADAAYDDRPDRIRELILNLKELDSVEWVEFVEAHSSVEHILCEDPAGSFTKMTAVTRDSYRHAVEEIAFYSQATEEKVAEMAVSLAAEAARTGGKGSRQAHVGYHLIDRGSERLKAGFQYRPPLKMRIVDLILKWPTAFYLIGIEVITLVIAATLVSFLPEHLSYLALILFLLATEPAMAFMNLLSTAIVPPRRLPRLDFSGGIPTGYNTMVVIPTLLISDAFVRKLAADLEVRYLANPDRNLSFALLTDFPDAQSPADDDTDLVELCSEAIRSLNRQYEKDGRQPFYLFHRRREWNPRQGAWMGWERKRGKLIALNNLLRGEADSFDVKVGDLERLPLVKYVITLDSDTELPRGTAQQLAGTLAHPLNRAVIDPVRNIVVEGYGILQPRVGISVSAARRSNLASIYSGQTGFDIYTCAVSDTYQDLFAEGSYCGKGIYDVDVFQTTLANRFPQNILLSHDLIEGTHARAGLVSDIELIDDYPSHYSAWSKRKHRWVRGDWQIIHWLLPRVPSFHGRLEMNPLSVISLWKIVDNLRRSLIEIAIFVLLIAGWTVLSGGPVYWTSVVTILAFLPVYMRLLFSLLRTPLKAGAGRYLIETGKAFASGHMEVVFQLVFLAHQTCLMVDAIIRSIVRTTVTRRRLLEWESAAEAELGKNAAFKSINSYLFLASPLAVMLAGILFVVNRAALFPASPFLLAWLISPLVALWLNAKLASQGKKVRPKDRAFLEDVARRTWCYFATYSTERDNWLIPDNVEADTGTIAHRTSPTNIGLLLNAHLAALDLGFIRPVDLMDRTEKIFATLDRLDRHRGHFLNWYNTQTLAALQPRYVSTVDSGNMAAALIALHQGLLELRDDRANELARRTFAFLEEMDFGFLLDHHRKLFFIGYNADTGEFENAHYDLLASEARIASFIAIAKNEIPQENWIRLGRTLTIAGGHRVLLSWSGTMFEYLMPSLWLRNYGNTLLDLSARSTVKYQQRYGASKGVPWGVSESASCERENGDYRYYAFGLKDLALKTDTDQGRLVIAPYASALALMVDPHAAVANLKRQAKRGWLGDCGFYESADFTGSRKRETLVKSFMAHHQGMSLIAIDNALNRNRMRERFHAEPMVQATELLLQERLPTTIVVEKSAA